MMIFESRKIAKGDEEERQKLNSKKKRRASVGAKIYNLVEVEVNDLYEKLGDIAVDALYIYFHSVLCAPKRVHSV